MSLDEQLALWTEPGVRVTVASKCLARLSKQYGQIVNGYSGKGPIHREADDISLACLLLCLENATSLTSTAADTLESCRQLIARRSPHPWLDCFVWRLAAETLETDSLFAGDYLTQLYNDISNGNSGIRAFMIEIAWIVRTRLSIDGAAPNLLKNVADTILNWDLSLGLCSSLFASRDEFWAYADAFSPPRPEFDSQYRDRLTEVKEKGLANCLVDLFELELRIRRMIETIALPLQSSD